MHIPRSIHDNLRFLTAEVGSQIYHLQTYIDTFSVTVAQRILDRSGYAHNLMMRIQNSCLNRIAGNKGSETDPVALRAVESIATDLEHISQLCRDCIHQMSHLRRRRCLRRRAYQPLLARVANGIELIEPALHDNDTRLALKIGRIEQRLDLAYRRLLKHYTARLKQRRHTEDLISALFVAHAVEQMGDALLNVSEAIISANLGQPINIDRYHSLRASVEQLGGEDAFSDLTIRPIAETRSGSGISGIASANQEESEYVAIYKDGKKQKLKEEREGVESWHEIFPGLAPRILSYHKRGQSAALLIEHLPGLTFEQILLHEPPRLLKQALRRLSGTLETIWEETKTRQAVPADHMGQLRKRMPEVYSIHPEFQQATSRICGHRIASFDELITTAQRYEEKLQPPFSVYIHGDFNVDNIIYDPLERRINFIDLHRSRYMDYVQDVSVFMVSNYRLKVLDPPLRQRILDICRDFYRFTSSYATKAGDKSFELRLALGLARSFATSTRFILDETLARAMFLRARYLIELVLSTAPKKARAFQVPVKEIFVG